MENKELNELNPTQNESVQSENNTETPETVVPALEESNPEPKVSIETEPLESTDDTAEETSEKVTDASEETFEEETESVEAENSAVPEIVKGLEDFEALVAKVNAIADGCDWQNGGYLIKEIKAAWALLPVPEGKTDAYKDLEKQLHTAEEAYFQRRTTHYAEMDKKRKENLEAKRSLLEKIEKLIERKKWMAQGELRSIQNKWEQIRYVPQEFIDELNEKYESLLEIFERNRVEFLVKKKEQEEQNLEGKLYIIDRLEHLIASITETVDDWAQLDHEFEELMKEWRKVGRVTAEKSDEVWNEFKRLKDEFFAKKLELNTEYRKELEANEKKKRSLIQKAQSLLKTDDLAEAAREINKLHKDWKEIGNVAPDKADELWNEFKAASDAFNNYKNEHLDEIKDQEKTNYDLKVKLCEKAEELAELEDWKQANQQFQKLMDEWKQIGPVPRRKTKKVWQRFKKAMDNFYARKRQQQKNIRSEEKSNLQKKRDLIEKVKALHEAEDAAAALAEVKQIQAEFNAIGFVPIKMKDKVYKMFKDACDVIYKRSREQYRGASTGYNSRSDKRDSFPKSQKLNKLKKQAEKLNETILNYADTKTFIKPNKKGLALRDEIDTKIAQLEQELNAINAEIEEIKADLELEKNQ